LGVIKINKKNLSGSEGIDEKVEVKAYLLENLTEYIQ
jgi:hypothetical protein